MNILAFVALLTFLGLAGANTTVIPIQTTVSPGANTTVIPIQTTVSPGRKLKCYSCPETRYYEDKEKCYTDVYKSNGGQCKTEEECPSSNHMCGRATYLIRAQKYVYRGCINMTRCPGQEYCKMDQNKTECDVACCNWNLCNGAINEAPKQCYTCTNSHAYTPCRTGATTCTSNDDMCVKVKTKNSYFKSCINEAGCKALKDKCENDTDCAVHCCYGNLCNSGMMISRNGVNIGALLVILSPFVLAATNFLSSP